MMDGEGEQEVKELICLKAEPMDTSPSACMEAKKINVIGGARHSWSSATLVRTACSGEE